MKVVAEVLIDPNERTLLNTLEKAQRAANAYLAGRRLTKTRDLWAKALREARRQPEGTRDFNGGRGGIPAAFVRLAWWTDPLGRRHWRIFGRRLELDLTDPRSLPADSLAAVYPDASVLRSGPVGEHWLVSCPDCGACGEPRELGWAGPCCGPCHDRREEGLPPLARRGLSDTAGPKDSTKEVGSLVFGAGGEQLLGVSGERAWRWLLRRDEFEVIFEEADLVPAAVAPTESVVAWEKSTSRPFLCVPGRPPGALADSPIFSTDEICFSPSGQHLAFIGQETYWFDLSRRRLTMQPVPDSDSSRGAFLGERRLALYDGWVPDLQILSLAGEKTEEPSQRRLALYDGSLSGDQCR
jgi:hypothetical protein